MAQQSISGVAGYGGVGEPSLDAIQQVSPSGFGILIFISSEIVFFGSLIITYILYRGQGPSGGPTAHVLDVLQTGIFSIFLYSSSGTMERALSHLHHNNFAAMRRWLGITVLFGCIFLAGQILEFTTLYRENITLNTNLWSSTFFTLTGFHGLHVTIGLICIVIITSLTRPGADKVKHGTAVQTISYYWHFVDAVWVVIFPVVYLWSLFS